MTQKTSKPYTSRVAGKAAPPKPPRSAGRPPKSDPSKAFVGIRVPVSWVVQLKALAKKRRRTVSEIIKEAVEDCYPEMRRPAEDRGTWIPSLRNGDEP